MMVFPGFSAHYQECWNANNLRDFRMGARKYAQLERYLAKFNPKTGMFFWIMKERGYWLKFKGILDKTIITEFICGGIAFSLIFINTNNQEPNSLLFRKFASYII